MKIKRKITWLTYPTLLLLILLQTNCKKNDANLLTEKNDELIIQAFFKNAITNDPHVQKVIDQLKQLQTSDKK